MEVAIKEVLKGIEMITEDNIALEVALMQQVNDVPGVINFLTILTLLIPSMLSWRGSTARTCLTSSLSRVPCLSTWSGTSSCSWWTLLSNAMRKELFTEISRMKTFKIKMIDFGSGALLQEGLYHKFMGTRMYSPP